MAQNDGGYFSSSSSSSDYVRKKLTFGIVGLSKTHINRINYSTESITAIIVDPICSLNGEPSVCVKDVIPPGGQSFSDNTREAKTKLILKSSTGKEFFNDDVCPFAIVFIDSIVGQLRAYTDNRYC